MQTYWKITHKKNGKEIAFGCFSKKAMVLEYLKILELPSLSDISELKIWKGEKDYTNILNKFLYPKK